MNNYSKEEIMKEAAALAEQMTSLDAVCQFRQAEAKLSANQKVAALIEQIKRLQKESVNLAHYQKHEAYKENEAKLDALQAELDAIPIVRQFQSLQVEVNDLLQETTHLLTAKVNKAMDALDENLRH
ncbi:MAG: YlbF family regulator [Sporolactobacillus sp.]